MNFSKIYVLHVKTGFEDRKIHIDAMMSRLGLDFEYILDGDMSDLDDDRLQTYFRGKMQAVTAATSCAYKHLLVYKKMVDENIEAALVLEDDIFLAKNFVEIFERSIEQMQSVERPFYVGYEATWLKLVPRSERRKGQVVYPAAATQCAGAYYINLAFAQMVLDTIIEEKCDIPFDIYLSSLASRGLHDIYWSYPVVAQQGSHDGRMSSAIGNSVVGNRTFVRIRRSLTFRYKKILYLFR